MQPNTNSYHHKSDPPPTSHCCLPRPLPRLPDALTEENSSETIFNCSTSELYFDIPGMLVLFFWIFMILFLSLVPFKNSAFYNPFS